MADEILLPRNTTKRTGIGCSAAGFLLLISAIGVFTLGFLLEAELIYVAIGATFVGLGILAFLPGIGLFLQGREVDKLLAGDGSIANWHYDEAKNGKREEGYIYIGKKGIYKNGLHVKWSRKFLLEDVFLSGDDLKRLTFQYVIGKNHSYQYSTESVRKKTSVPVPPEKLEDAERVMNYYRKEIKKGSI